MFDAESKLSAWIIILLPVSSKGRMKGEYPKNNIDTYDNDSKNTPHEDKNRIWQFIAKSFYPIKDTVISKI